jgi:hypothetical protein
VHVVTLAGPPADHVPAAHCSHSGPPKPGRHSSQLGPMAPAVVLGPTHGSNLMPPSAICGQLPPSIAGTMMLKVLCLTPSPHVTLQGLQSVHSPTQLRFPAIQTWSTPGGVSFESMRQATAGYPGHTNSKPVANLASFQGCVLGSI